MIAHANKYNTSFLFRQIYLHMLLIKYAHKGGTIMRLLILLMCVCLGLTGCLHHKSKKEKHLRSKEKKVNPVIKEYHETKKVEKETPKVVESPPEPPKQPDIPIEVIPFPEEDKKKDQPSGWWPWND